MNRWLMIGLAVGLRLWRIDAALWYDEAFTAWLVGLPLPQLLAATLGDVHPPGYYLLVWGVAQLLGSGEIALRLPSLLAGLGLIIVVYHLAMAMDLSDQTTWLATGITALVPFQIYYSQEARAYAVLSLALALAGLYLLQQRYSWAVAISLLAGLLHNMALVYVACLWLAAVVYHKQARRQPLTILSVGYGLSMPWLMYQANQVTGNYWIPPLSSAGRLVATLDDLIWFTPNSPFVFATALITSLVLVLMLADLRSTVYDLRFLVVTTTGPLAIIALASILWQPVLISRVMAPIAPFLYLWLASTITQTPRRLKLFTVLGVPTLLLITLSPLINPATGRAPLDEAMANLYGQYQQGDGLYHANVGSYVVWHYYRPDIPQYLWPQDTNLNTTLSAATRQAMAMQEADFSTIACSAPRWWLIQFNNPTTTPAEITYINGLIDHYHGKKIAVLRNDTTTEGYLILLEPHCYGKVAP